MRRNRQKGIVLVVTLILLVVLTLFVLSSTRLSTGNLRIVGNMQARKAVDATAQQTIEQVLSGIAPFYNPTAPVTLAVTPPSGMTVTVSDRRCIQATTAPGYSAVTGVSPDDTFWNLSVSVTDAITNSTTTVTQGVRIRLPAGNCPPF